MKFNKLGKILLVFLILVMFMNIVCANENISANENLTSVEDTIDLVEAEEIAESPSSDIENNKVLSSEDSSEGIVGADSRYTGPHLNYTVKLLNESNIYPYEVLRYEVNITNDGTVNYNSNQITFRMSSYSVEYSGYQSEDWTKSSTYSIEFKNTKPLNVGESSLLYIDYYCTYSGEKTLSVSLSTPRPNYFYISGRESFTITPIKAEITKKLINTSEIFMGDYVTFNITVKNINYEEDGKKWINVRLRDTYSTNYLKFINCSIYNSKGEKIDFDYNIDSYSNDLIINIDELDEPIYILTTFKATEVGVAKNKIYFSSVNKTGVTASAEEEVTISPYLTVSKSAKNSNVYVGDVVEYEVVVENIWNKSFSGFRITENIPNGLTFLNYGGKNWIKMKDYVFKYTEQLNPGEKAVLYLNFTVNNNIPVSSDPDNPTEVLNKVTLNCENNYRKEVSVPVNVTKPTLIVNKITLNDKVELGDNVIFNITITDPNNDNRVYNDVMIRDIVPNGLEFISCYGINSSGNIVQIPYSLKDSDVIFKIAKYYHNTTIIATFKTTETGNLTNKVIYGLFEDKTEEGEYSQDSVLVYSEMLVKKTCMNETIFSGDTITYMINVTNNQDYELNNIILNEIIPSDLTYSSFKGNGWSQISDNEFKYGTKLAPHESAYLYLTFVVSGDAQGYIKNKVTVSSDETKNVTSTEEILVKTPTIRITKKASGGRVNIGDNETFIITLTAADDACYHNIDITDVPQSCLEFLEAYYIDADGNEIPTVFTKNGDEITFHIDELNKTMQIYAKFKATESGVIKNAVNYKDTTKECIILVNGNLGLIKGTEDIFMFENLFELYHQGDEIPFWILLSNNVGYDIFNLTLTEDCPDGLTFIRFAGNNWIQTGENTFKYNKTFASKAGTDLMLYYKIDGNISGKITNKITASSSNAENETSSYVVDIKKQDIKISKLALNESVWVGDKVTFDIIIENNSTGKVVHPSYQGGTIISASPTSEDPLGYPEVIAGNEGEYYVYHDVQITDIVPDGLEFESCYGIDEYGERIPVNYRFEGKNIVFQIETLHKLATIKATFKAIAPGNHTNIITKDDLSSNDTVEVKTKINKTENKTSVENETVPNSTDTTIIPDNNLTKIPDQKINKTTEETENNNNYRIESSMNTAKTGNPIFVLLLVFLMLSSNIVRKIKK